MKKKLLSVLLAVVALASVTCLTACGDDDDNFSGLKSEKIASAEAWAAAFDLSDVTNARLTLKGYGSPDETEIREYDGNKQKCTTRDKDESGNFYEEVYYFEYREDEPWEFDPDRGTAYRYSYDEETKKWSKSWEVDYIEQTLEGIILELNDVFEQYDEQTDTYTDITDCYADFTYDEKTYSYVCAPFDCDDEIKNIVAEIKFKNGNVAEYKITLDMLNEETGKFETRVATFSITDIDKVTVTLPTVEAA